MVAEDLYIFNVCKLHISKKKKSDCHCLGLRAHAHAYSSWSLTLCPEGALEPGHRPDRFSGQRHDRGLGLGDSSQRHPPGTATSAAER